MFASLEGDAVRPPMGDSRCAEGMRCTRPPALLLLLLLMLLASGLLADLLAASWRFLALGTRPMEDDKPCWHTHTQTHDRGRGWNAEQQQ